jgi:hypothetical protein
VFSPFTVFLKWPSVITYFSQIHSRHKITGSALFFQWYGRTWICNWWHGACYYGGTFIAAHLVQAFPAIHNYKFLSVLSGPSLDPTVIPLNAIKILTLIYVTYHLCLQLGLISIPILSIDQSFVCLINVTRFRNRNVSCAQNIKCQRSTDLVVLCTFILSKIRNLDRGWAT